MKAKQSLRLLILAFMLMGAATHTQAQEYITEVTTIGAEFGKGGSVINDYRNKGWTVLGNDLNCNAGGWDIYIAYKTSSTAHPETGYITDICASDKDVSSFTFEGRTYYKAPTNSGFNGDLNRGAGGAWIFIYYTRDRGQLGTYGADRRVMTKLSVSNQQEDGDSWTAAISWRNSDKYSGICDVNKDAGGDYIYIHQHFTTQTLKWTEEPVFATGITYNGEYQYLITKDPWSKNYGKLQYRLDGGSWSSARPTAKGVGNYTVEARLEGVSANDINFANNSSIISKTVTINPPIARAINLTGVFNQGDKRVNLTWEAPAIAGNYTDYKWVVYRDGTKIAELSSKVRAYADRGYSNESMPVYDVYYVPNFWDVTTQRNDTKATVTVSTTRSVPVRDLKVEQQADRIVFTWTSDAYAAGFGNEFRIYVDDEEDPIYTLTPTDMQGTLQWEHRTTDQHTNRQNKVDGETGVPYTEEPLNACAPHTYRIEGVIGDVVLNTYSVNPKAIGEGTKFYSLDASKGVYEGSVKLSWHVDQQGSPLAKTYVVERRRAEQEGESWEVLTRLSSNEDYLFYTDETALPGVYYDYRITVEDKCSDGTIINNEVTNIGFAKSSGTMTGRIAYGSTGTAVRGVDVVMAMTSSDGSPAEQFHSVYFADTNGAVTWQYPADDYAAGKFAEGNFSLQMWLYPEAFSESLIADFGGGIGLGMTTSGEPTFCDGTTTHTFAGITLHTETYNHMVLTRSGTTLTCYVLNVSANSSEPDVQKATLTLSSSRLALSATHFHLGHFKGAVDEFRLWTKCLSEETILENYDHLLVGDEQQLETYWTFDEGLRTQFFDYSRDGSNYRKHHGQMGSNAQTSTLTPGALRLKAKTDADGNYIIQGIPFSGEGTTYSVTPLYGIHEFNPTKKLLFIGSNALVHTADFEDVSAFPMSGYVYYAGTNIPAEGIQFYVDGELVTANGEVKTTDSQGYYQFSVPIGHHYVQAKMGGHKMVANGRFPTVGTFNFDRAMTYDFADSTLVNFVGRIAGGQRNDTLAVGFAESKNNIGIATIRLGLLNESFSLNTIDNHAKRTWQSDTASIASRAWTGTDYDAKYVYIRTDSLTGEFSALLPPLKYITKSIRIDSNPDIEFYTLPEIDMTNALKQVSDSLKQATELGDSVFQFYTYNTKMVQTYFSKPVVELSQPGSDPGVFGINEYKGEDALGKFTVENLWTKQDDGSVKYTYGFPIYNMGDSYRMTFFGYERYLNNDSGQPVEHIIPLNGQVLTIANEMSADQKVVYAADGTNPEYQPGQVYDLKTNQIVLDSLGRFTMKWNTGAPNVVTPFTRHLGVTLQRNGQTYVPATLDAVVVGSLPMGNNFVTNGPDKVLMVLRDPPGGKSKTVWKRGTTTTKVETSANGGYGDEKFTYSTSVGAKTETYAGLGIMTLTLQNETTFDTNDGIHYKWSKESSSESSWSMTATQDISTSTTKDYCGSRGDVFIGVSTNLLMGQCRKVGFFRENESAPFELTENVAVSLGDSVKTNFMYSTYELEEVMMPKWKETRNNYLTQHFNTEAEARAFVNNTNEVLYATWLKEDDEDYGKKGTYIPVVPAAWEQLEAYVADDMVQWCNDQIESWTEVLENNERDKVESMADHDNWRRNISFDGGSNYTYTSKADTVKTTKVSYSHNLGYMLKLGYSSKTSAFVTFKSTFSLDTENGWSHSESDADKESSYAEFDYIFEDGNKGTDFSVDIYKSKAGWSDIFSLFGGQSYNPYQGEERTKYFEKGQHILSNGTVRMEQPDIQISVDGTIAAKEATLTDVPSGQTGQFTLHLSNNSTTTQGFDFSYNIMVQEMADTLGLEILMDGVPANGRSVFVPAGETVKKIITVRQTDQSILDYEGVEIWFLSQYQPIKINDKCRLNVHFRPSSSGINLVITDPVLNIETLNRNKGNLELTVKNFDRQFKGMKKVGVEYRFEGATQWTQPSALTFLVNPADSTKEGDHVLPATGDLRLTYNMADDNMYPQGTYTFRAYTTTMYDTEPINVYSSEVTVVKDNQRPRNLTTPLPANGILRYGDDLVVEFNEDIVPGYVSDKNIIVTAKLNDQPVQHDVAKLLAPFGDDQVTVNPIFLNGDFSVDFWMKWQMSGSILRLGSGSFAISVDDDGHIVIGIGDAQIVSTGTVPKDEWTFFVMSYKSADRKLSALAQHGTTSLPLFTDYSVAEQVVQQVQYYDDNHLYLGNMDGAIHDLSLFNIYRDVNDAAATKNQEKDYYVYGLVNYWPMKEGHGTVATDARHTHDFRVNASWLLDNTNYSLRLDDGDGVTADISRINTTPADSYAVEMWASPGYMTHGGEGTIFETGSKASNQLGLYVTPQRDWILRYGGKEQMVVNHEDFSNQPSWNHVALNVVRGQAASFYFNGQRTAVIAERDVPQLEGAAIRLGCNIGLFSVIDEVRIWHASLSESRLLNNMYNCIDTAEVYSRGLVAYYPFEKPGTENGVSTRVPTLEDMAPRSLTALPPTAVTPLGENRLIKSAPPLKNAPTEHRIIAKPVASERKVVVRLEEGNGATARNLEGTTLNITVDKIHDMHGNESMPIRWTTYVQLNTLKWLKDSVNINKPYGDDYTFDVNIENRSGNIEYYTLYNMPQWLTLVDSERTDDIAPQKTKTLRFHVSPLVAVGNYDVTIGLQGNNEILEPLRIVMKVQGQKPAWAVDPTDYENTMSVVGQIYINGILMSNSESMLAAFIGDECRGIAQPKPIRGAAYVALSVYGTAQKNVNGVATDLDKGQPVTFRIWDATTGMTYTNVNVIVPDSAATDALIFDPTTNYGNFDAPLVFTKSNLIEQQLNIRPGWNWIALGVEPGKPKVSVVFKDVVTWNAQLKDKSSGVAYSSGNYWAGTLKEVHANTMYKLQLTRLDSSSDLPEGLAVNGEQVKLAEMPVTIGKGWNWIAYTPLTTMTLGQALASANPKVGDQVKSQTGFAYFGSNGWEGNLEALESGHGYLYHSVDTAMQKQFVYPTVAAAMARGPRSGASSAARRAASAFTPVEPTDYPDNMAVVLQLTDGGTPVTDAEVAAFIDGECRGTAFAADEGDLYYLLVAGEGSGQPMELRASINGAILTLCTTLTYTSDASIGTPWEPLVIDINGPSGVTTVGVQMADGVWYTLQGMRYGTTRPTTPGVYLYNGQKVVVRRRAASPGE